MLAGDFVEVLPPLATGGLVDVVELHRHLFEADLGGRPPAVFAVGDEVVGGCDDRPAKPPELLHPFLEQLEHLVGLFVRVVAVDVQLIDGHQALFFRLW